MASVTLRRARLDDLRLLLPLVAQAHALEGIVSHPELVATALGPLLAGDEVGGVWLVLEDEATAGYAVLTWSYDLEWAGREAFLAELFLGAEARGRRVGTRALPLLEAEARAWGARALHLMVREDNQQAQRLYRTAGFEVPPRLLMTKALG